MGSMAAGVVDGVIGPIRQSPVAYQIATVPTRLLFDRSECLLLGASPRANPKPVPASDWPAPKCRPWPPNEMNLPVARTGQTATSCALEKCRVNNIIVEVVAKTCKMVVGFGFVCIS